MARFAQSEKYAWLCWLNMMRCVAWGTLVVTALAAVGVYWPPWPFRHSEMSICSVWTSSVHPMRSILAQRSVWLRRESSTAMTLLPWHIWDRRPRRRYSSLRSTESVHVGTENLRMQPVSRGAGEMHSMLRDSSLTRPMPCASTSFQRRESTVLSKTAEKHPISYRS